MASAYITRRVTSRGAERYAVRYRLGGRETPVQHAGTFARREDAERRCEELWLRIAAGKPPTRPYRSARATRASARTSVYVARSANGGVLYVGITGARLQRVHQHAASSAWWPRMATLEVEHFKSRAQAEARERELILKLRPVFNVTHTAALEDVA